MYDSTIDKYDYSANRLSPKVSDVSLLVVGGGVIVFHV